MNRPTLLRTAIAAGSIAIAAVHLRLYFTAYRDVPIENLGRSFVLNAIAATFAAAIVLVVKNRSAILVPLTVANATLVAFGMSRTSNGIFGFTERGWTPTPDAAVAVIAEIVTAVLCVVALASLATRRTATDPSASRSTPDNSDTRSVR